MKKLDKGKFEVIYVILSIPWYIQPSLWLSTLTVLSYGTLGDYVNT